MNGFRLLQTPSLRLACVAPARGQRRLRPNRVLVLTLGRASYSSAAAEERGVDNDDVVTAERLRHAPFRFITGLSFAAKPRIEEELPDELAGADEVQGREGGGGGGAASREERERHEATRLKRKRRKEKKEIGFAKDSKIGRWRDKLLRGGDAGEDALFCTTMSGGRDVAFGVADGVGGWAESNIDPSLFSQALLFHASKAAELYAADDDADIDPDGRAASPMPAQATAARRLVPAGDPSSLLRSAFKSVLKEPGVVAGSSTACIVTLDSTKGRLRAANLGDSSFVVLRNGHVVLASRPQTYSFNCPFQLAKLPRSMIQAGSIQNGPGDADRYSSTVRDGDLVIVGTDGLFDNVFQAEVMEVERYVRNILAAGKDRDEQTFVQYFADYLVSYAKVCQALVDKRSPFEKEAEAHGLRYPGGKVDDVAVVVALVVEQ